MTEWARPSWRLETAKSLGAYFDSKPRPRVQGAEKVYEDEYRRLREKGIPIDDAVELAKKKAGI